MTTCTQLPAQPVCPKCSAVLDGAMAVEEGTTPKPDDLFVCAYCAELAVFTSELKLRSASRKEIAALPGSQRRLLRRLQQGIRARARLN